MDQISLTRPQYFKQLDGFRCMAIFAVMITHFVVLDFVSRIPLGLGVLFFFVLSSFLITRILILSNENTGRNRFFSLRQFYIRRILRIFPVYYLTILALFILNVRPCRELIFYLLSFTVNFKIASGMEVGGFNHLWSLSVEEQFYLFIPFIVLFIPVKYLWKILIAFVFVGLAGRALLYDYDKSMPYSSFNTVGCLDSFGLGGILAYLSVYKVEFLKKLMAYRALYFGSILTFMLIMIFSFSIYSNGLKTNFASAVWMKFLFNIMSFWILGYSVTYGYTGVIKRILENRVIVYLGRISYGLYLFHLFVPVFFRVVCKHFKIAYIQSNESFHIVVISVIYILTTIACASISWFFIEKPFNEWRSKFN
jgi:peptidoglycan/LPS O-acetylase OafA/YrhL